MDHPKKQISSVIHSLTSGSPAAQKHALDTYFLPDASFTHPLCRVPRFKSQRVPLIGDVDSRWVIWMIYRWYKILSPRISLRVDCEEFNQQSGILFVDIQQRFSLFFVPFYHADVRLTTKLHLVRGAPDGKFYIQSQEDLYQTNEVVKFFWPGGATVVGLWQIIATVWCVVGALAFAPLTWLEQKWSERERAQASGERGRADGHGPPVSASEAQRAGPAVTNGVGKGEWFAARS